MSKFVSDLYIENTLKNMFAEKLPQYVKGDDAWKINWNPNVVFERPDDLYWMDIFFIANEPYQAELGTDGRNVWTGFMQININVPKNDVVSGFDENGIYNEQSAMNKCYEDIAKVFRRGVIYKGVRIVKTSRNTSALQVYDDFCSMPVTIRWKAYLSN